MGTYATQYMNNPYAIPGSNPGVGGYGPVNNAMAIQGPVDIYVQKPHPGMPASSMAPVVIRPRNSVSPNVIQSARNIAGVNYAATVPISSTIPLPQLQPTADIPPPHLVAPYLFNRMPRQNIQIPPLGNQQYNLYRPNQQNNYYQPQGGYPNAGYPNSGYQGYQNPQPPAASPLEQPPPTTPTPELPTDIPTALTPGLTTDVISNLNDQLNDTDWQVRSSAALEIFKILKSNPDISQPGSQYKPIVDAFMLKILRDPSPVVRQPALLAFETENYFSPSPEILQKLQKLSQGTGLHHLEPKVVENILAKLSPAVSQAAFSGTASQGHGQRLNILSPQTHLI